MDPKQSLNIAVVEDEPRLRETMLMALASFGHRARGAADGTGLDLLLQEEAADIVLLDLGLPGEDGIAIAQRLRRRWRGGIVMVTARDHLDERILGMENGADLYFVKPVDFRELDAGLRSLARRLPPASDQAAAGWRFSAAASTLRTPAGVEIALTARECILLQLLFAEPGRNVSRATIFAALGDPNCHHADLRLERMISRLRAKVRKLDGSSALPVRARHNIGYVFLAAED